MSAAPRFPFDVGLAGVRMTADEYLLLGETFERYELIDGVVVMSPSPTPRHQQIIQEILFQISSYLRTNHVGRVFADTDVRFDDSRVYCPDLVYFARSRMPLRPERLEIPPDLAVEVLSTSTKPRDLITKRNDYERFGVAEYWVVDSDDLRIRCWRREAGRFVEHGVRGDSLSTDLLPGFALDLVALRAAADGDIP